MNMNNLHSFKALDDLLRCTICFDYFNVCMMTACSHNYCSFCIRKYLTYRSECPVCFEKTSEPELRNNRLIDELVQQHISLRNLLQKIEPESEFKQLHVFDENNKSSRTDGMKSWESDMPFASSLNHFALSQNKDQQPSSQSTSGSDNAFCPVCSVPVQVRNINNHLDICLKRSAEKSSDSREKRKSLPKVVYHLMSDKDLKKRLMEFGLSTKGDRQVLQKRHKSFLVLYNAECDSLHPRPVSEIVTQVEREEKEEGNCPVSVFSYYDRRIDPSIISDEQENYMKVHKKQYDALIEDIRSRQRTGKPEEKHHLSSPELFSDESLSDLSWNKNTRNEKVLPPPSNDFIDEKLSLEVEAMGKGNLQENQGGSDDTDKDSSANERYIKDKKTSGRDCRKRRTTRKKSSVKRLK